MNTTFLTNTSQCSDEPDGSEKTLRPITTTVTTSPLRQSIQTLRSLSMYFWYTGLDGSTQVVPTQSSSSNPLRQVNAYTFNPSAFAKAPCPPSLRAKNATWHPQTVNDLLIALSDGSEKCVGDICYTSEFCEDESCGHMLDGWIQATGTWYEHLELRETRDRGIGVFSKTSFKEREVLGWYAGTVTPDSGCSGDDTYLMELPVGHFSDDKDEDEYEEIVAVDGKERGNWTRFVNHSCEAYCEFHVRRVGKLRIMTIEAIKDIPDGIEITAQYGTDYFGEEWGEACCCGAYNCTSKFRNEKRGESGANGEQSDKM